MRSDFEDGCWDIYLDEDRRLLSFDLGIFFNMARRVWLHTIVVMCYVFVIYLAHLESNMILFSVGFCCV